TTFVWPDRMLGWDCLTLERDWGSTRERPPPIWVGRRMPLYSGHAGIQRAQIGKDCIELLFTKDLAEKLQLQCRFASPSPSAQRNSSGCARSRTESSRAVRFFASRVRSNGEKAMKLSTAA